MAYGTGHGGPARGRSWGGPANGPGWGGPARGVSTSRIRRGDPDGIQTLSHDPAKKAARAQRTAELEDMLYDLALHSEHEMVQLRASEALLDRLEGRPVARKASTSADAAALKSLTDAELARVVEERREEPPQR